MRYIPCCASLAISALVPLAVGAQTCNTAERTVAIILDASGSMHARLSNGETRMVAAQRAVKGVAAMVAPQAQLGLRLYGARSPAKDKNCEDSHVAVAFAPAETLGPAIQKAVDGARAQGYTPIAYSLEQAANDFPASAKQKVIVLVSDGKETCKGDPVLTAKALAAKGITIHAIGFVADSAAQMQLKSIASSSGGSYFDAPAGTELPEVLKSALNACPQKAAEKAPANIPGKLRTTGATWLRNHVVVDARTGKEVANLDSAKKEVALPAGVYEVSFGSAAWKGIEVRAGETTTISPAALKVSKSVSAKLVDSETGEIHGEFDAVSTTAVVMPGIYDLVFSDNVRWPFIKLDGGKTVTLAPVEIRLPRGLKYKKARILRDGKLVAAFDAVTTKYRLPPGDYVVEVDGKAHPAALKDGETFEVNP